MTTAEKYRELSMKVFEARARNDEDSEDRLLEQMDDLWFKSTAEDREAIDEVAQELSKRMGSDGLLPEPDDAE